MERRRHVKVGKEEGWKGGRVKERDVGERQVKGEREERWKEWRKKDVF